MRIKLRHHGPGPHPDTGTPQSVHGGTKRVPSAFMALAEYHVKKAKAAGQSMTRKEAVSKVAEDLLRGYSHEQALDAWHEMESGRMAGTHLPGQPYSKADWRAAIDIKFGKVAPKGYEPPVIEKGEAPKNWLKLRPSMPDTQIMAVLTKKVTPAQMKYLVKQVATKLSGPELKRRKEWIVSSQKQFGGEKDKANYERYDKLLDAAIAYKAAGKVSAKPKKVVVTKIVKTKAA